MDFRYSELVNPFEYGTEGLCDEIPLRIHNDTTKEDMGAIRCQQDWIEFAGPLNNYKGGLDAKISFMSVTLPECLPERLEILSYANELAFLYDDISENLNQQEYDTANDDMLAAFIEGTQTGTISYQGSGMRRMQAQLFKELLDIDTKRGLVTIKAWVEYLQLSAGLRNIRRFQSLEEYIPYRIIDLGKMFWHGMITLGMAITLSEAELQHCEAIVRPAWIALGLQNDYYSWDKEVRSARSHGRTNVVNAIAVLMQEHSVIEDQAKQLCKEKTRDLVLEYNRSVEESRSRTELSYDMRRYLEALRYSLSGNAVWSLTCPRYHPESGFNERQLAMMAKVGSGDIDDADGKSSIEVKVAA